jgi:hypothetical protein
MTHYHEVNYPNGDLKDKIPFCSDTCHQEWCQASGFPYEGWNGCHETPDYSEYCRNCGVIAGCGPEACDHQRDNFMVNRVFIPRNGEQCSHGNWIQVPRYMLE